MYTSVCARVLIEGFKGFILAEKRERCSYWVRLWRTGAQFLSGSSMVLHPKAFF